jgi:prepilin-type processing-associated H-X9-DG protein
VGTISSCLYLLVKYAEVTPKSFICTQDKGITEFKPGRSRRRNLDLIDFWDFGPEPWRHYSYSYHMPFGEYALTTSYLPGVAVAADRNPWMASPFAKARVFSKFDPDGGREGVKAGNTIGHHTDGQNVLFVDSHVGFEKVSFCGINEDNIYTYWDGEDVRRGVPPVLGSQPQSRTDSMLVHDPPVPKTR